MTKHPIKHFLILASLLCFIIYSAPTISAQNTTSASIDKTIEDSYASITNIQKQLSAILKSYFLYLVDDANPKPSTSTLTIYANQLNQIYPKLTEIANSTSDENQKVKSQILISAIGYLKPAIADVETLLTSTDANRQYTLFRSIIYLDNLLSELLSYF